MSWPLLGVLAWTAAAGLAQQPLEVRRGDFQTTVRLTGTVVASDIIRLRSTIEGRVEDILVSTYTWVTDGRPLGHLANKEMAAIFDSHTTTEKGVLEERWRRVYQPTPILCPSDCYLLRAFVKNKEWLRPKAALFEAAQRLRMVGRVRPEDAQLVKDGQRFEYWARSDPTRKFSGRVAHYILDIQGEKVEPGGSFTIEMDPSRYFPPGTEWEGVFVSLTKKNVLLVPTDALIEYAGATYLPVRVSTGVTTRALTEITAGVEDKRRILVLDDARLKAALRHAPEAEPGDLQKRVGEEFLKSPPRKDKTESLPEPDVNYGEDPYAQ